MMTVTAYEVLVILLTQLFAILAHFWGDYIVQSDWMAQTKTKSKIPALAHVLTYGLCFTPLFFLGMTWAALAVIVGTHFAIDHWRLARYVCYAKNILAPANSEVTSLSDDVVTFSERKSGVVYRMVSMGGQLGQDEAHYREVIVTEKHWRHSWEDCKGTGYHKDSAPWMVIWLMIIADNTIHITINAIAILFFFFL